MPIDIEAVAADVAATLPSDEKLLTVGELAKRQLILEGEVADLESITKARKAELRQVSEELLPEAMLSAGGLTEIALEDGAKIAVAPFYSATISAKNRTNAHAWLRAHGHDDLIKHELKAAFGRGDGDMFDAAAAALAALDVEFVDEERVHSSTLRAFVREQTEAGIDLPQELGVFIGQRAKITKG